ncbi:protein kinase domain-containing protein [Microbulbifer sp. CnH-101-E]|uniref:protein kinase domain-containing protein n=1 Tax=unclassified Microbulbifer TaxID=2619833 RepID=UPI004039FA6B
MDVVALEKTEVYQGRYRVERTLGAGGMGVVYLAEDVKLGRKVAIKQLRSDMTGNSAEARFRSEAQLLARLNHPNIVRLYDVLEEDHNIALVMELVEGVTLKEWIREHTATLAEKLDLLMQICQGLGKAHCLGIIHRDLKPENILVTNDGVAKITDFGIAKALDCDQQLTREDHIAGSVQAMSPEQLQGTALDARSDLFSLGSIAYELLCGSKPFERGDKSALAFAQQITSKPHIPPQQAWPEIPKPLAALLDRLLGKRPEQRPESAERVCEAIELVRKHGIDNSTLQYSETVTQLLIKPKKKYRPVSLSLIGLIIICTLAFWGWRTYLQLPPQYIAVLPVQMNGTVSGEENAEILVKAMVRQALLNAPAQLQSSALVSYNAPKEEASYEEQLKSLHNKGVTDALLANLECMQLRCNIELQRINPSDSQVHHQTSFVFLSDKIQEAQYTIGNSAVELFPKSYRKEPNQEIKMSNGDYNRYLTVLSKIGGDITVQPSDLVILQELIGTYPQNINLYSAYAKASATLFSVTNDNRLLSGALGILTSAEGFVENETSLLEAKLLIKSLGTDRKGFESILKKLQTKGHPSAHLLAQFSRFQYLHGNHEQSLAYAKEAAALSPSFNNLYYIAINELALGDYEQARTTLKKMIKIYPERWKAYNILGVIELKTGNLTDAETAISSIPENRRDWQTRSNLGTTFFLKGEYKKALVQHKKLYQEAPNNITTIYHLAETYLMLADKKKADEYFGKIIALTIEARDVLSRRYRAEALAHHGKTAESISLIKDLLRDAPDSTNIMQTAALVYTLAGEWQSASYHLEQLIQRGLTPEWFSLPAFQGICVQPQVSQTVTKNICP